MDIEEIDRLETITAAELTAAEDFVFVYDADTGKKTKVTLAEYKVVYAA